MNKLLTILAIFTLYLTFIFAAPLSGKEIVDEARTVVQGQEESSNDTSRTIMVDGNITVYHGTLKLSSASKRFSILITDAFHLPNTLVIENNGKETMRPQRSAKARDICFIIRKEDLKAGDKVVITTKHKKKIMELKVVE